jgi:hypothetical protein
MPSLRAKSPPATHWRCRPTRLAIEKFWRAYRLDAGDNLRISAAPPYFYPPVLPTMSMARLFRSTVAGSLASPFLLACMLRPCAAEVTGATTPILGVAGYFKAGGGTASPRAPQLRLSTPSTSSTIRGSRYRCQPPASAYSTALIYPPPRENTPLDQLHGLTIFL